MRRHTPETNILSCYVACVLTEQPGKQADLAACWGVTPDHMSDLKSYKRPVQLDVAVRIAEAETGGSCDALLEAARAWWETEGYDRIVAEPPDQLQDWLDDIALGECRTVRRAADPPPSRRRG